LFWAGLRRHLLRAIPPIGSCFLLTFVAVAQTQESKPAAQSDSNSPPGQQADPLKRPISKKEQAAKRKAQDGVEAPYRKWIDEDVIWIITPEERSAFAQLSNDEERDQFIEAFWQRRDPTPNTIENEYKEEHYRRIAYANEHFRRRDSRMENRPGAHLHHNHARAARRDQIAPLRGHLRPAVATGRGHDLNLPLRGLAISISRRGRVGCRD
jgi:GWxTD domain-containing protein